MNRIEFMTQLAALLQDVPVEERREAMQYYNDYFDDAGAENEQKVIAELESPKKVAENLKDDLKGTSEDDGGFTDAGMQMPQKKDYEYQRQSEQTEAPETKNTSKLILVIVMILVGIPILVPLALAVLAVVLAGVVSLLAFFGSLVAVAVSVAIVGIVLIVKGIIILIPDFVVGIGLLGIGLILTVFGTVFSVAVIRLCMIVLPAIFRAVVKLGRKLFHRKAVA